VHITNLWPLYHDLTIISASTTLLRGHENLDDVMREKAQLFERLRAEIGMY
jgi:hypothetical protein